MSTSSRLATAAETDASVTPTSAARGSATASAASVNGVVESSSNKGLTWTAAAIGLCLLVGQ